ncbi:MAG: 5-formyltetrahydrofolate cyclo-ligase [Tannerella sp.]|jgi:5-formyltetrahydrofolate cyclo-ligase|nr:5-formyltetrahydrofolate cyclo-ligase [Tannerella sp.]
MQAIREEKQRLRDYIKVRLKSLTGVEADRFSRLICCRLAETPEFQQATCVALYSAMKGEVQTDDFIENWHQRKKIVLPVVVGDNLIFKMYAGVRQMKIGSFGILEPCDSEIVDIEDIDLFVVPGMAFDRHGNRLGRGKGFYDRLLARVNKPVTGLCYYFQLFENIPTAPHDRMVDRVIC